MTVASEKTLDRLFYALSDPSRRKMLQAIAVDECQVKHLANSFTFSKAATSKHLNVLEEAGLIEKTRKGREVFCSINPSTLQHVEEWVTFYRQFWDQRLDNLETFLTKNQKNTRK